MMVTRTTSNDNSPESLLLITVNFIISNQIEIQNVCLPSEICKLLFETYRSHNINKEIKPESLSQFIYQFSSKNARLTEVKLADLPISNSDLYFILSHHAKTLKSLDINNCTQLTESALHYIRNLHEFNQDNDYEKMIRSVIIFERRNGHTQTLLHKKYQKGEITSFEPSKETIFVGIKKDDLSIFESLGVFAFGFQAFRKELIAAQTIFDEKNCKHNFDCFVSNFNPSFIELFTKDSIGVNNLKKKLNCAPKIESCGEVLDQIYDEKNNLEVERVMIYKTWYKSPLESLIIGKSIQILPMIWKNTNSDSDDKYILGQYLSLRVLVINQWTQPCNSLYLHSILTPQMNDTLQYLDLSNCAFISEGSRLVSLTNLQALILYNCPKLQFALPQIQKLKSLRYLDISASNEKYGYNYIEPNEQLHSLVTSLENLTHLDISGTNLAGPRYDYIKGLKSRLNNYFEFLGLYNTSTEGAYRPRIPALRVAGEASENQILTACEVYIDRVEFLKKSLNDLFHCFRFENDLHDVDRSLKVVLYSMSRHLHDKQIQIAASASLFFIVKSDEAKNNFSVQVKRQIISRLLDAMQVHKYDNTMLRNGSLTLIHFKIPQDVLFDYTRLVKILLQIVMSENDDFIQRLGIFLLNSLACQVDGDQKTLVGELGAVDKMLKLIRNRLLRNICDEVMETAWSTMWNVTDENPTNCQKFLNKSGLDLFEKCMDAFPDNQELLRNMMGLLGNVAECKNLRHYLMKPEYIERFSKLLWSETDSIEVGYNAAGIFAHIASDGPEFWSFYLSNIDRNIVLSRMESAISRWKINSSRNINYRSFEPILRLLDTVQPSHEAKYWAVWALANLTRVNCAKYCPLFLMDDGLRYLKDLLSCPDLPQNVEKLAHLTLFQIERWVDRGHLDNLEESEEIDVDLIKESHR